MRLTSRHRVENAHEDSVWAAAWTPADTLITGSVDETVKVWTPNEATESQHTYTGHTLGVISVDVDSSGTYATSSALDSFIRVWNLSEASTKAVMETPPSETWKIRFHPTADTLTIAAAGGSSNGITLWSCETAQTIRDMKIPGPSLDNLCQQKMLTLGDLSEEEKTKKEKFVLSVAYSPDGRRIACGAQDGTVCIFDCESGKVLHSLEGHYKPVRSVLFTPDSQMVLTACDDMHLHLYDAESGELVEAFSGHESWVVSVACHPSGNAFVTGSSDSKVKLWDLQTRSCVQTISDHTDQVWEVAFTRDGSMLASVSDDKSIAIYNYTA